MAVTARTWVEGELANAAKLNTIRDDILELDAVAGFEDAQFGTVTILSAATSGTATISAVSARAQVHYLGQQIGLDDSRIHARITKTDATTITATRESGLSAATVVAFCVSDPRG